MSSSLPVTIRPTDCCATSCEDSLTVQVPGPAGAAGAAGAAGTNGNNAYTTTSDQFTMPAVGADVTVEVALSSWASIGQVVHISTAGYFAVQSKPDSTHISVRNLGYTGNAAPTTVIATSQSVSPGGLIGATGAAGAGTLDALSPTTTKGDIIVDNGANSPSASDVRFGVGTDGQQLTAVAAQPTGLQWKTLIPNAGTDNGVPRFDGATGTPIPLQTSNVVITDNGAIQASGSGGNARGTDAVDLQVARTAATQVASGIESVITGGTDNTASGNQAAVAGGDTNTASGLASYVGGGSLNVASGAISSIAGGSVNTASNDNTFIGGGDQNTASGNKSCVLGGESNTASGDDGAVLGGRQNTASGSYSSTICGREAVANKFGQSSQSAGMFALAGDSQTSVLVARNSTANATPTELFLDGSTSRITIGDDTTWAFRILVVARRTDANDESAAYEFVGCIDRNVGAGTTAIVGSVTKVVVAEDTAAWDCAVTADAANGALIVTATGEAAKTIRWTARIELVEVSG